MQSITVDPENPVYYSEGNCIIYKGTNYEGTPYVSLIAGCRTSVIPDDGSVTVIDFSAFEGRTDLTEITIPEGVEYIDSSAFADRTNLTTVHIPKSVRVIEYGAFEGCDRLSVATYSGTQDEWENNVEIDEGNDPLLLALPFYKDKGDVDGTPGVSAGDRTYLARALAGWEGYAVDPSVADLTGDGEVTAADRTYLARYLAGWEGYALE